MVESLNKSKIGLTFWEKNNQGGAGRGFGINYNIFEVGSLYKTTEINPTTNKNIGFPDFDDEPVFFEEGSEQILDIKQFIDNPFIPKHIADCLLNFYCSGTRVEELGEETLQFVAAESNILEEKDKLKEDVVKKAHVKIGKAFALRSWENLKILSFNLTEFVKKWFDEHGIKDLNIRIDYKNIKPH